MRDVLVGWFLAGQGRIKLGVIWARVNPDGGYPPESLGTRGGRSKFVHKLRVYFSSVVLQSSTC